MENFKKALADLIAYHPPQSPEDFAEQVVALANATAGVISFYEEHPIKVALILNVAKDTLQETCLKGFAEITKRRAEKEKTARG